MDKDFKKCPCGNVAGLNQDYCARCRAILEQDFEQVEKEETILKNQEDIAELKNRVENLEKTVKDISKSLSFAFQK